LVAPARGFQMQPLTGDPVFVGRHGSMTADFADV